MRLWKEFTAQEQRAAEYSDFYKSVHGFRPRVDLSQLTLADLDARMAALAQTHRSQEAYRLQREAEAQAKIEADIAAMISAGAKTRETALRWILQSLGQDQDAEAADFVCYQLGLPYGYFSSVTQEAA